MSDRRINMLSLWAPLVMAVGVLGLISQMVRTADHIADAQSRRFRSHQLADEVRQSSDDLSRMARTYVVTGDARYEKYFERILAIRDGRAPRPVDYEGVYWDFVTATGESPRPDGESVALESMMRDLGFTADEFGLLDRAKELSDRLVVLEQRAMHAVKGLFPDSTGAFSIRGEPDLQLAADLLHDSDYNEAKASIMAPIDQFIRTVDERTEDELFELRRVGTLLGRLAIWIAGLGALLLVISLMSTSRRRSTAGDGDRSISDALPDAARARISGTAPLLVASTAAVLGILLVAWWNQVRIDEQIRADVESALTTVLQATTGSIREWFRTTEQEARVWAGHVEVVEYTRQLADRQIGTGPLGDQSARAGLKAQLDEFVLGMGFEGYLVVSPEGKVLASHDEALLPVGTTSFVGKDFLARSVAPPRFIAVELPYLMPRGPGTDSEPTMLVASAIRESEGAVVGILILLVDPHRRFTQILQRGRLGESGESYAFDRDGRLISDSRFDDQLRELGLIGESERSILNIQIRDPGVDLTKGIPSPIPLAERPLTYMAERAIRSGPGLDLDGYNDYRGVSVVGAWTWDETNEFGVATEMDVANAFRAIRQMRRAAVIGTLASVLLVVALIALFLRTRVHMVHAQTELERLVGVLRDANDELESVNSVILRWGPDGRVRFLNQYGLDLFRYSFDEIVGQSLLGTIVPVTEETRSSLARMTGDILRNPAKYEIDETENLKKDGERVWMAWRNKPVAGPDGGLREILTLGIDISARKRAETQLVRQSIALEAADDGVAITDTEGNLVWVNQAFSELTGYGREEVIGRNPRFLKSGEHAAEFYEQIWQTINSGHVWHGEIVNRRKDGSLYTEDQSITPVRDESGQIVNYVAIKRDISKRKEAEHRLRSVTESAIEAVISSDSDSQIIGWNRAAEEMFGWSPDEILGEPVETIIPERFRARHSEGMKRFNETGEARIIGGSAELSGLRRDGRAFPIEMSLATWTAGGDRFYTAIVRNITERKRMEVELEKARLRMEEELNVGREIQMGMLPLIFPPYPRRSEIDVFATVEPAREVGGDFYDFFLLDDDHFCVCVGDVSGKGVPAALFMAVTKTLIKSRASNDYSPASILTHVNSEISYNNDAAMFVTIFLGIVNLNSGELRYTNAGHNPPYIRRVDGDLVRLEELHGPVVGIVPDLVFGQDSVVLRPGDLLFTYTDGVTEAMNESGRLYGDQRLAELLGSHQSNDSRETVQIALADVKAFQGDAEQADDITILTTTYFGMPEGSESKVLSFTVADRLDEIERANRAFDGFAEAEELPVSVRRSVNLVLDELLNNVISYAFPDDEPHEITLRFELSGNRLSINVVDDGIPFNPFSSSPPDTGLSVEERAVGGLGIHLVRNVMDEVSYTRRTDQNVVILIKYLDEPAHP